jgi:hypothetical protein
MAADIELSGWGLWPDWKIFRGYFEAPANST